MSESQQPNSEQNYTLTLHNPRDKYYVERSQAVYLVIFSVGICAAYYFIFGSAHRPTAEGSFWSIVGLVIILTLCAVIPLFMAARMWLNTQSEDKLVASDTEPVFMINADGISLSIIMLEDFQRGRLRKNHMPRVSFRWDQIGEIRFSPGGSHHAPKMRILPIDDAVYIVDRDKFMGSEKHIVEVLRAHGAEVLVESELH
ncbi:MAG: hypothetical protein P4L53_28840 [Candidatus Obscuribacterales bacterium]|nr:hypothetical protein [Candidatus Obscuribacterales bacterium]